MNNRHLFLAPELLSRLSFSQSAAGDFYVQALSRHKPARALPEEIIRQLMLLSLVHQYAYPEPNIRVEYAVQMGRTKKRADIVVLGDNGSPHIVIETKQIIDADAVEQLKSYMMVTGAQYGMAVSGYEFVCLRRDADHQFVELADVPLYRGERSEAPAPGARPSPKRTSPLRARLNIELFEKTDQTHVKLAIQGRALNLALTDLASYKKTQKRFLAAGVILTMEIKQADWLPFIHEELAAAPAPAPQRSIHDEWASKITAWLKTLPSDRSFLTSRVIANEVFGESAKNPDRKASLRIASTLRALGWESGHKRVNGTLTRGYIRGARFDELKATFGELL